MDKIIKWIEDHKIPTLIIFIAIIFAPMIAIHILFKIDAPCDFFKAKWGAGDVLGYFGDVLSFIGTVVLGYVAIRQTERANQLSHELLSIDEISYKTFVRIDKDKCKVKVLDNLKECSVLLCFENISKIPISSISIEKSSINLYEKVFDSVIKTREICYVDEINVVQDYNENSINDFMEKRINFHYSSKKLIYIFSCEVEVVNMIGKTTKQLFTFFIDSFDGNKYIVDNYRVKNV